MFSIFRNSKGFTLIEMLIVVAVVGILGAVAIGAVMNNSSVFGTSGNDSIVSTSGVKKADVTVTTNADGRTSEQENIIGKLAADNKIGAIKHLYIISAYSGQVILYSTVKGKVTSSGKRLSPTSVSSSDGQYVGSDFGGVPVKVGNRNLRTSEVLQDDGTYGSSMEYLYWWNTAGVGHKHYVTGGQIVHISEQPLSVKSIIINMEKL